LLVPPIIAGCAAKAKRTPERTDEYDRTFLTYALDHLEGDLRIARTCKGKHIRPELAAFCAELYNDQSREHARMAAWLTDWYQEDPPSDRLPLWFESQDGETFELCFIFTTISLSCLFAPEDGMMQAAFKLVKEVTEAHWPPLMIESFLGIRES
jgi:Domain of unknown function (DUF305)